MKLTKEFKAGLIAIIAILFLIFGYNYLKGNNLLKNSRTFYAVYDDVQGLGSSSPVTINGLQIGQVTGIKFLNDSGKIIVQMSISSDFEFSKTSIVKIYGGDFIGGKSISIVPDFKNSEIAVSEDTLTGKIEDGLLELVNEKLTPLQGKVERSVVSIDSLVTNVNSILNPKAQANFEMALDEFTKTLVALRGSAETINKNLNDSNSDLNQSISNFKHTSEQLAKVSDSLSLIEFNSLVKNIDQTLLNLNEISTKIASGEGTLGKFIHDKTLYDNLEQSSKELELLLRDLKENPKRYVHFSVFGKKNKPYKDNSK